MDTFTSWKAGVTPQQMREVDRLAEEEYGLSPFQLMEVAGLATARVARKLIGPSLSGRAIRILAGPGNNGADGLVAARRLSNWGAEVTVATSYDVDAARGIARQQLETATAAGVEVDGWQGQIEPCDLVVDALLGFGAQGPPRGSVAEMIAAANHSGAAVLALDIPSGVEAELGMPADPCVVALATVTLALPKTGLLHPDARGYVGRLFLADIGIPPLLLADIGVDPEGLFDSDDIIELRP